MKILLYAYHPSENEAISEWQANHPEIQLDRTSELLDEESVLLAKGYDGITTQQTSQIENPFIFKFLKDNNIKQIALRTAGYDMVDLKQADKYDIKITHVPAYSPNAIAELALTQTMNLIRNMYKTNPKTNINDFTWEEQPASEIRSLTIGVIGVGKIGSVYAKLVSSLGAKVIAYDPIIKEENKAFVDYFSDLESVLKQADVISIHTPLNETTEDMINKDTLKLFKSSAYLINTARGPIVNSKDLINAIKNNEIAGAALDTVDCEVGYFQFDCTSKEIDQDLEELLALPNVLITPHIAFYTKTAIKNMIDIGLGSVLDILNTGTSKNLIKK